MPQLNTLEWPPQLFWLAVTFIALYFVISRIAIPRTGGTILARRAQIEGDLASAQALKSDTDRAIAAYEASLAEARQKAHAIMEEVREKLAASTEQERSKLDAELAGKIAAAEVSIAATRSRALGEVANVARDVAADIVRALTGAQLAEAEIAAAVSRAAGK